MARSVEVHQGIAVPLAVAVQVADEPTGHPGEELRQVTVVGRVENELAHPHVPREVIVFHDFGEICERPDGGVVERVLLGRVKSLDRRGGERGDVEEGTRGEGQFLARIRQASLVSPGHPHVIDDKQVRVAEGGRPEPAERDHVVGHQLLPGAGREGAVVSG